MSIETATLPPPTKPVVGRSAWKVADLPAPDAFCWALDPDVLDDLRLISTKVQEDERIQEQALRQDFPALTAFMARVREELDEGRGFAVLRGLPLDLPMQQVRNMYWAMGSLLGKPVSQSAAGERLAEVKDRTRPGELQAARGYTSRRQLPLHTDNGDYMGLFCVREAKSGGKSLAVSIHTVFNDLLAARPDLLEPLFRGFPYHRRGEQQPGQPDITPHDVPVLGYVDGRLSGRYLRSPILVAYEALGREWDPRDKEALDVFDDIGWDKQNLLEFNTRPGDVYFANNWLTLHSRTEFEDHDDEARKRLMLRIWCQREAPRSDIPSAMRVWDNPSGDLGIDGKPGGQPASSAYLKVIAR